MADTILATTAAGVSVAFIIATAKHIQNNRRHSNGLQYVTRELFDERTGNLSKEIGEVHTAVTEIRDIILRDRK